MSYIFAQILLQSILIIKTQQHYMTVNARQLVLHLLTCIYLWTYEKQKQRFA